MIWISQKVYKIGLHLRRLTLRNTLKCINVIYFYVPRCKSILNTYNKSSNNAYLLCFIKIVIYLRSRNQSMSLLIILQASHRRFVSSEHTDNLIISQFKYVNVPVHISHSHVITSRTCCDMRHYDILARKDLRLRAKNIF